MNSLSDRSASRFAIGRRAFIAVVITVHAAPTFLHAQCTWSGGSSLCWTLGNVGIGTSNPQTKLNVDGGPLFVTNALATTSRVMIYGGTDGGNTSGIYMSDNTGAYKFYATSYGNGYFAGNVGIGTSSPQYRLAVNGNIGAQDIIVTNTGWSDFVFRPGYRLSPLSEVSQYIQANGHLPDIPTEAEVQEKGVSLGDMQVRLLAKIEELTLHMIQADQRNDRLERQNQDLRERIARLEKAAASDSASAVAKAGALR